MAEARKVNKIPTSLIKGKGKKKEVYTHFISMRSSKAAKETVDQVKSQFKKMFTDTVIYKKEKLWLIFIIKND